MDIIGMLKQAMMQAQAVARGVRGDPEAVAAVAKCGLPGCGTITAGARCEKCSRAICIKHTFLHVEAVPPSLKAYCPYCVLALNPDLFRDDEDDEADGDETSENGENGDEPLDAEYTRE